MITAARITVLAVIRKWFKTWISKCFHREIKIVIRHFFFFFSMILLYVLFYNATIIILVNMIRIHCYRFAESPLYLCRLPMPNIYNLHTLRAPSHTEPDNGTVRYTKCNAHTLAAIQTNPGEGGGSCLSESASSKSLLRVYRPLSFAV